MELDQIANGGSYQKRNVVVKTRVEDLVHGRYLGLTDGVSRVMLILFYGSITTTSRSSSASRSR